jgi:hypothetical protein
MLMELGDGKRDGGLHFGRRVLVALGLLGSGRKLKGDDNPT